MTHPQLLTISLTGGSNTTTNLGINIAGNASNTTAQMTVTNAEVIMSTASSASTITVGSGTFDNQTAVLNINSGALLQISRLVSGATIGTNTTRHVNFNGGTIRLIHTGNDAVLTNPFLASGEAITAINIYSGGATFDVVNSGAGTTIARPLLAPAGNGVSDTTVALTGADRGAGYVGAPVVLISGATGATAVANMEDDGTGNGTYRVASITITSPGINAVGTPTFSFVGGGATTAAIGGNLNIAANVSGGLTKIGAGTVNIFAANTYTGQTRVEAGTLTLQNTGDLSLSSGVHVSAGATFNATNKLGAVIQSLSGAGTVVARNDGTLANRLLVTERLAPGDSVGTLTITDGDLRVGDGVVYEYEIGGTTEATVSDLINITRPFNEGDLTFEGSWTLKLFNLGTVDPAGKTFVLFDYTGLVAGIGSWDNYTIDYGTTNWAGGVIVHDTTAKQILLTDLSVIPEPGSLALIGIGMALILKRRK